MRRTPYSSAADMCSMRAEHCIWYHSCLAVESCDLLKAVEFYLWRQHSLGSRKHALSQENDTNQQKENLDEDSLIGAGCSMSSDRGSSEQNLARYLLYAGSSSWTDRDMKYSKNGEAGLSERFEELCDLAKMGT